MSKGNGLKVSQRVATVSQDHLAYIEYRFSWAICTNDGQALALSLTSSLAARGAPHSTPFRLLAGLA